MVGQAFAEEKHEGMSADEVAKQLANPNNDFAKLAFKNQYRWYKGDLPGARDQDNYTLLFQPIFPFSLGHTDSGGKQVLFIRPAIPLVVDQTVPKVDGDQLYWDDVTALGDIGFDVMYGVTEKSGLLWAAGMVGTLPSATDMDVSGDQWRLGPEALLAVMGKHGVVGVFPSHQWNVGGRNNHVSFNTTQIQPLLIGTPGGGWQIASKPIISYDWEGEEWTVPLSLSVAKTLIMGSHPVQFEVEVNYYVEQPDAFGPRLMLSFNVTPVVSNFIENMLMGKK